MDLKYLGIFVAILVVDSSAVEVDSPMVIKYKKLEATTVDNPYFGEVTTEISDSGLLGSAKFSLKKFLPEETKISLTVELKGEQVADYQDYSCELMKNEAYGKDIIKYGLPKDTFPKECPFVPGDYEVSKYPIPKDKFPPFTPPGDYDAKMSIGESGQEPWVIIKAVMEVSQNVPGLGR